MPSIVVSFHCYGGVGVSDSSETAWFPSSVQGFLVRPTRNEWKGPIMGEDPTPLARSLAHKGTSWNNLPKEWHRKIYIRGNQTILYLPMAAWVFQFIQLREGKIIFKILPNWFMVLSNFGFGFYCFSKSLTSRVEAGKIRLFLKIYDLCDATQSAENCNL